MGVTNASGFPCMQKGSVRLASTMLLVLELRGSLLLCVCHHRGDCFFCQLGQKRESDVVRTDGSLPRLQKPKVK